MLEGAEVMEKVAEEEKEEHTCKGRSRWMRRRRRALREMRRRWRRGKRRVGGSGGGG